jgi:ComF family protein
MCESLEENEVFFNLRGKQPLLVPVPLYSKRLKSRGYNHAALLASHVAQYYKLEYREILIRIRNTKPQFKLKKIDRSTNVLGAFEIKQKYKHLVKDRTVLVVDDIATTCSTLNEISKTLKRAGAREVWGVVFAREDGVRV